MWLYAYEATTQGFIPGASDVLINQDEYFSLLRMKRVQFLAIDRGYTSTSETLRTLRGANERMRQLQEAIQNPADDELHNFDDDEIDHDDDEIGDFETYDDEY
jgi:hypothetical protein